MAVVVFASKGDSVLGSFAALDGPVLEEVLSFDRLYSEDECPALLIALLQISHFSLRLLTELFWAYLFVCQWGQRVPRAQRFPAAELVRHCHNGLEHRTGSQDWSTGLEDRTGRQD